MSARICERKYLAAECVPITVRRQVQVLDQGTARVIGHGLIVPGVVARGLLAARGFGFRVLAMAAGRRDAEVVDRAQGGQAGFSAGSRATSGNPTRPDKSAIAQVIVIRAMISRSPGNIDD